MTDDRAVFRACVHGLRTIPTRKVAQVTIEVPIEELPKVASICEHGAWVAVARLQPEQEVPQELDKSPRTTPRPDHPSIVSSGFRDGAPKSAAQQAAIQCSKPAFWRFLREKYRQAVDNKEQAAECVRQLCGVKTRRELVQGTNAYRQWQDLSIDFRAWMLAAEVN